MKKLAFLAVALFAVTLLIGCVAPIGGASRAPIMLDVQGAYLTGDSDVGCTKVGVATSEGIILFSSGDSSIKAAMDAGGITEVHHVDYKITNILGLYCKWETTVYGE